MQWRSALITSLTIFSVAAAPSAAAESSWPTCRGNAQRTAYADVTIPPTVGLTWSYHAAQKPQPAWPPPARGSLWQRLTSIAPRVVDDHAFHPVLADDAVLFASSANDSVHALDAATGKPLWRFTTDGPVRYAPVVLAGRVYFGSDDGRVYCVDAAKGKQIWSRQIAPRDLRIPGNGRLISAWPVRTGVLAEHDTIYATAGLFPSQRVVAVALDAQTGEPCWSSDLEYAAQGYLLTSSQALFVPTGRGTPLVLQKTTGKTIGHFGGAAGSYGRWSAKTNSLSAPATPDHLMQATWVRAKNWSALRAALWRSLHRVFFCLATDACRVSIACVTCS